MWRTRRVHPQSIHAVVWAFSRKSLKKVRAWAVIHVSTAIHNSVLNYAIGYARLYTLLMIVGKLLTTGGVLHGNPHRMLPDRIVHNLYLRYQRVINDVERYLNRVVQGHQRNFESANLPA